MSFYFYRALRGRWTAFGSRGFAGSRSAGGPRDCSVSSTQQTPHNFYVAIIINRRVNQLKNRNEMSYDWTAGNLIKLITSFRPNWSNSQNLFTTQTFWVGFGWLDQENENNFPSRNWAILDCYKTGSLKHLYPDIPAFFILGVVFSGQWNVLKCPLRKVIDGGTWSATTRYKMTWIIEIHLWIRPYLN